MGDTRMHVCSAMQGMHAWRGMHGGARTSLWTMKLCRSTWQHSTLHTGHTPRMHTQGSGSRAGKSNIRHAKVHKGAQRIHSVWHQGNLFVLGPLFSLGLCPSQSL